MEQTNKKSILYARVSSREQEETGYSLDAQEKLLKEYAEKHFKIVKTYKISESAAGKQIRKTFSEMMGYIEKNNIPIIVCEKIDRLTRNLKDAAEISDWLTKDEKRSVHFVKENFIVNKNTKAHENLVWDMKVAIARFYTNNLSEEVRKGQKEKLAQGWAPMRAKIGYKTIGEKGHKIHIVNEEKAPFIRKMFELYATGNYSIKALVDIMYKEGLRNEYDRKVIKSRMHKILSDPFYCGKIVWMKGAYDGKQDHIISKELFDVVQAKLARKTASPQYRKHLPVFKAMIKCEECGGMITWELQKGCWYGHCNHYRKCSQKTYVRQDKVEEQLFPYFDRVAPKNERIIQWLEKALKESHADEIKYNNSKKNELTRIITTADRRIEAAYKDKLDSKMPADICKKIIEDSTQEKEIALNSLKGLTESRAAYYEAGYAVHELALKAKDIYLSEKATIEDKRLLLSYLFKDHTLQEGRIAPNYTFAFEFLSKWMPKVNPVFAQTQNTAEACASSGGLFMASSHHAIELLEPRNNFRTSKKLSVKAQPGLSSPTLRPLLRHQDSNLEPTPYTCSIVSNGADYIIIQKLDARRFPQ